MKRLALPLVLCLIPAGLVAQELDSPRPIPARHSVWIDQLTYMEVRDAIAGGKTTVILATGGTEQNGPYSVNGKHTFIVGSDAEAIAERLGDALVAPVVWFEAGGDPEATGAEAPWPGTFQIRTEVYMEVLRDVAAALKHHGFKDIVLIGDNGGNQTPMANLANELNPKWAAAGVRLHHIPEYYAQHGVIDDALPEWGVNQVEGDIHDSYRVEATLMAIDPNYSRIEERIASGHASINGVSVNPPYKIIEHGKRMQEIKTIATVQAIRNALSARTTSGR